MWITVWSGVLALVNFSYAALFLYWFHYSTRLHVPFRMRLMQCVVPGLLAIVFLAFARADFTAFRSGHGHPLLIVETILDLVVGWLCIRVLLPGMRARKAANLVQSGHYEEARTLLLSWVADGSGTSRDRLLWLTLLGFVETDCGDRQAAADYFSQALNERPNDSVAKCNLGMALHGLGRSKEGLRLIQEAARSDHLNAALIKYNLCIVLAETGRVDEARSLLPAALQLAKRMQGPDRFRMLDRIEKVEALCDRHAIEGSRQISAETVINTVQNST